MGTAFKCLCTCFTIHANCILALALVFILSCFKNPLPWSHCGNDWNSAACVPLMTREDPRMWMNETQVEQMERAAVAINTPVGHNDAEAAAEIAAEIAASFDEPVANFSAIPEAFAETLEDFKNKTHILRWWSKSPLVCVGGECRVCYS